MTLCKCENALRNKGIQPTSARILVMSALIEQNHPVSLSELETVIGTVDKSTIFRTLGTLLEHHAVHAFEDGSGSTKYEVCRSESGHCPMENRHIHFFCEKCRKTFCIDSVKTPVVELPDGYELSEINYMVKGVCPSCSHKLSGNI